MQNIFTQDISTLEREAGFLLDLFEKVPDNYFTDSKSSIDLTVRKLKSFARVYQNLPIEGADAGFVIN